MFPAAAAAEAQKIVIIRSFKITFSSVAAKIKFIFAFDFNKSRNNFQVCPLSFSLLVFSFALLLFFFFDKRNNKKAIVEVVFVETFFSFSAAATVAVAVSQ